MKRDTEPHLWPTWNLSPEEADRFYRGSGRVTIAVDENNALLSALYHSRCETREALQSALAQMHSDFPHAVTLFGSMRGHYFCEDLPHAGWRSLWELEPASELERDIALQKHGAAVEAKIFERLWGRDAERAEPEHGESEPDMDLDR
jgi:hypothetical protein